MLLFILLILFLLFLIGGFALNHLLLIGLVVLVVIAITRRDTLL